MLEFTGVLPPPYERKLHQYADFLASIGIAEDRYVIAPQGSTAAAEITVSYGAFDKDFGDIGAETNVATGGSGRTLRFASGLREALYHLAWYFDNDRASAIARALDSDDVQVAMQQLGLDQNDVVVDGRGDRSGHVIQRSSGEARLILVDTYGEVVPIATSTSAATLAYIVRSIEDVQASNLLERTAAFVRRT